MYVVYFRVHYFSDYPDCFSSSGFRNNMDLGNLYNKGRNNEVSTKYCDTIVAKLVLLAQLVLSIF